MRTRVAAIAAGILLAGGVTPVTAAPSGTLTLTGSTSAWTTLDVPAGVGLDTEQTEVAGRGRFGGFFVDTDERHQTGVIWLRGFKPPGEPGEVMNGLGPGNGELPRGRVRIYLVADGPTTVRIPVTGMASRTIRPGNRTTAAGSVQELRHGKRIARLGRQPVNAARRSVSMSAILLDDTQVFVGTISVCLTRPEGKCDSGGMDSGRAGWYVNPYGAYPFIWEVAYAPGVIWGRLDAVQEAENVAGIAYAAGGSFTLALA
jgi:hypothetical protein